MDRNMGEGWEPDAGFFHVHLRGFYKLGPTEITFCPEKYYGNWRIAISISTCFVTMLEGGEATAKLLAI
ncbi:hypothetical protein F0562_008972 [Nyssa sinensis]|uniref:Uncharacterized protein n=1 Tax=Nyssa sinensis TaxID=561372 RepID=A0A5J5A8Z7_9ASTE|nr:hypothetical protein F0562_008972 [Nyssa sinensis]